MFGLNRLIRAFAQYEASVERLEAMAVPPQEPEKEDKPKRHPAMMGLARPA